MKKKKLKQGSVQVQMSDLDRFSFSDMNFFNEWIPDGCELVQVQFYYEDGCHHQSDYAYISIEWKEKE